MKFHFFDLIRDIKAIIGMNGLIWIYYSTVKLDSEYFSDDQNKLNSINKNETPSEYATVNILLFRNIIKALEKNKLNIDQFTIMKFYEYYIALIDKLKLNDKSTLSELEHLKSRLVIKKEYEGEVIEKLKVLLQSNTKSQNIVDLNKEVENMRKMVDNNIDEMDEDD
jgi:hypothetical protein